MPGQWFEGCYVFASDEARAAFEAGFEPDGAPSPGTGIVGSPPILVEPCEIVAVAQGWDGFAASPRGSG